MSHAIFQTTKITPMNNQTKTISSTRTLSSKIPFMPPSIVLLYPLPPLALGKLHKSLIVKASCLSPADALEGIDAIAHLERCLRIPSVADRAALSSSSSPVMYAPVMNKDFGAFGAVTLEKSKLDTMQKQTKSNPEVATGGGDGDIGKSISHRDGDGGDDDGNDDSYFDDFDDGDEEG